MTEEILTAIGEADFVLIGIGEEFDEIGDFRKEIDYIKGRERIEEAGCLWLLPAFDERYRQKRCLDQESDRKTGLCNLAELLKEKNYFVISTAMNSTITDVSWKEGRLVVPCGGTARKQCVNGCENGLQEMSDADRKSIADYIYAIEENSDYTSAFGEKPNLGICPKCGKEMILNNIYAENYDENGYLSEWQLYTKWIQGTLNKKLVILELGVGMKFPSVIRWPFEKIAFFNSKAHIFRVNGKLYQLSEELKGKGTAIPKNSIDWLLSLC